MNQRGKQGRRRWFQFSLGTLFVVMTIVAVWLGMVMDKARKLRRSVDAITTAGGAVYFRHQKKDAQASPPGPAWLRRLVGDEPFITPRYVRLTGPEVTDDFIAEHVGPMTSLEDLQIESPNVTDAGLACLSSIRHLHWIELECPRLTDAALVHVASLPELYKLSLPNCPHLTDAALAHIAMHSKLGCLTLNSPHLTVAGLHQLKRLKHLEFVRSYRDLGNERTVHALLNSPAVGEFDGAPLIDVMEYLVDFFPYELPVDLADVPEAKRRCPITISAKRRPQRLEPFLDAILEQCDLGHYFENGTVRIAPREIARQRRQGFHALRSILPTDGRNETDW